MDYGTVACWASNQVGKQRTPCLFQVNAFLSFILRCTGSLQFSELFTTRYYLKWTILGILGIENNLNMFIVVWTYTADQKYTKATSSIFTNEWTFNDFIFYDSYKYV